jgi:hypothetical protein
MLLKKIHYGMLINEICYFLMRIFFARVLPWVREEFLLLISFLEKNRFYKKIGTLFV